VFLRRRDIKGMAWQEFLHQSDKTPMSAEAVSHGLRGVREVVSLNSNPAAHPSYVLKEPAPYRTLTRGGTLLSPSVRKRPQPAQMKKSLHLL
jgi:hypothetical protein